MLELTENTTVHEIREHIQKIKKLHLYHRMADDAAERYENFAKIRRNAPSARSRKRTPEGRFLSDSDYTPDVGDDYSEEADLDFPADIDDESIFYYMRRFPQDFRKPVFPSEIDRKKPKNRKG